MIPEFQHLNESERQLMYDAIPLITVLIAGADGHIDPKETEWAEKVTEIRGYSYDELLMDYYKKVGSHYQERLDHFIHAYPQETEERTRQISEELSKMNQIFPKLDEIFAHHLYKSFVSFARHVAEASGGFLRFGNISKAEKDLIDLPMVDEV